MFFKIENGTLIQRSLPIWKVHYRQYPPGPTTLSKSHSPRVLYPSPLPSPTSFTSECFFRTAKAYSGERKKLSTQQHFSFILMSCFMISTLFSIALTFFSMLMLVKTKYKLTPTWFEHAAFWSGVRRATIAPRSQPMVTKSEENLYLFLSFWTLFFYCNTKDTTNKNKTKTTYNTTNDKLLILLIFCS